jgi:hypothetical protein
MRPRIIRASVGGCCKWCNDVAGVYEYPNVPKDVFRRHRYCRCIVEYDPGDGSKRKNVHTKRISESEDRAMRSLQPRGAEHVKINAKEIENMTVFAGDGV